MAKKATHSGTCQLCGSRQMLPGGLLSLHGYNVQHGWFNGICDGARQYPLEQSRELLDEHCQNWEKNAVEWLARAERIERGEEQVQRVQMVFYKGTQRQTRWVTREECAQLDIDEKVPAYNSYVGKFIYFAEQVPGKLRRDVSGIRGHIQAMQALAKSVCGKPLVAVEQAPKQDISEEFPVGFTFKKYDAEWVVVGTGWKSSGFSGREQRVVRARRVVGTGSIATFRPQDLRTKG